MTRNYAWIDEIEKALENPQPFVRHPDFFEVILLDLQHPRPYGKLMFRRAWWGMQWFVLRQRLWFWWRGLSWRDFVFYARHGYRRPK